MGRSKKKNRKTRKEIRQQKRRNERRKNQQRQRQHQMTVVKRGGPPQEFQASSPDQLLKQWWDKVEDFEECWKQMKSQLKWLLMKTSDHKGNEIRISKQKLRPDSASEVLNCLDYGEFVQPLKHYLQRKLSQFDGEFVDDSGNMVDAESAKNERNSEQHSVDSRIDGSHSSLLKQSSTSGNEIDDEDDYESVMDPSNRANARDDEINLPTCGKKSGGEEINQLTNVSELNAAQEDLSILSSRTQPRELYLFKDSLTLGKRQLEASDDEDYEDYLVARSTKTRKKNFQKPESVREVNGGSTDSFSESYSVSAKADEGDGSEDDEVDNGHPNSSEDHLSVQSKVNAIGAEHLDELDLSDEAVFYTENDIDEHTHKLAIEDNAGLYLERHRSSDEKDDCRTEDGDSRNDPSNVGDEDLPPNRETPAEEEQFMREFGSEIVSDTTACEESGPSVWKKKRTFDECVNGDESASNIESRTETCISPPSPGQTKTDTYANLVKFVEKIKGFLNELTESNLQNLATQMEQLRSKRSRHANPLKSLTDSFIPDVLSPERNVMQKITPVTIHHANICSEEDSATVAGMKECTIQLQEVSSLLSSSTVPNVGTPDNYRIRTSVTDRDPDTTSREQASSAQFSNAGPWQQRVPVYLDSPLPAASATVAQTVPSSVHRIRKRKRKHYTDFKNVPDVEPHERPYVYVMNWPHWRTRFLNQVFRCGKDRMKCQRCDWLGRSWEGFRSHYHSKHCAKAEDNKTNVSIYREVFVDKSLVTPPPKPGEVQYFSNFRDLPLVIRSEPPYAYTSAPCRNVRFTEKIFRKGIDFAICCKCERSYQKCESYRMHWTRCHKECNKTPGITKRVYVH